MRMSMVILAKCVKNEQYDVDYNVSPDDCDIVTHCSVEVGSQCGVYGITTRNGGLSLLVSETYAWVDILPISFFSVGLQMVSPGSFVSMHRADESYFGVVYDLLHVWVGYLEFAQDSTLAGLLERGNIDRMQWFNRKKAELEGAAADREEFAGYGYIEDDPEFSAMEVSARDLLVDGLSGVVGLSDLLEIVGLLIGLNEARFVCAGESDELLTVDSRVVDLSCARMPDGWWVATQKISHAPDVKGRSCSEVLAFGREDIVKDAQWVERLWGQEPQAAA